MSAAAPDEIRSVNGRSIMSRSTFDRKQRHDYAGRKDGRFWTLTLTDAGTCLIPDVAVVADEEFEKVADLERIANGDWLGVDEYSNDELLRLGIGYGIPGPLSNEQVRREAAEILSELDVQTLVGA